VKRFGVSLPQELAEAIDKISQETGATRSEVVAAALQEYLASASLWRSRTPFPTWATP
jgi:CopG family nickel-responsive transcriptional regulator